jgi:DNA (cytosine-5)-methyltransferase 1
MYRLLDLFSGIGGFSLGLERSGGFKTVAFCEIDPYCRKVLAKHWPEVPQYDDVRTLTAERLAADGIGVDAICGGFPCQPFSTASRGRRRAFDFWPEMRRLVAELRPSVVIAENVQELPIKRAAREFENLGYCAVWRRIGADDAGADHTRDRWWSVAYTYDKGKLHSAIHAEVALLPTLCAGVWGPENYARAVRVPDGLPHRMDRFKQLGNTVIPYIPQALGRAVMATRSA